MKFLMKGFSQLELLAVLAIVAGGYGMTMDFAAETEQEVLKFNAAQKQYYDQVNPSKQGVASSVDKDEAGESL